MNVLRIPAVLILFVGLSARSQTLSLEEAVSIAGEQSPMSRIAVQQVAGAAELRPADHR